MPRPFWKGAISFGMVMIPVRLYVGTRDVTPRFHLLHKKCHTRLKQALYCPRDDEYVRSRDTVRGYEYAKGQYVIMNQADFDKVPVKTKHRIDVVGFVDPGQVDPVYYADAHYLEPEELGERPFALLHQALQDMDRAGVAKVTFQRREHLCLLRPLDDILALHTLHYQAEVRSPDKLAGPEEKPTEEEMKMARTLIEQMSRDFQPDQYEDGYRKGLEEIIQAKVRGEEVVAPEEEKVEISENLLEALRQSLEAADARSK